MMCANSNEEILSADVKLCPYCHITNLVSERDYTHKNGENC